MPDRGRTIFSIRIHATNVLFALDLIERFGQHWCIPGVTVGDIESSDT